MYGLIAIISSVFSIVAWTTTEKPCNGHRWYMAYICAYAHAMVLSSAHTRARHYTRAHLWENSWIHLQTDEVTYIRMTRKPISRYTRVSGKRVYGQQASWRVNDVLLASQHFSALIVVLFAVIFFWFPSSHIPLDS